MWNSFKSDGMMHQDNSESFNERRKDTAPVYHKIIEDLNSVIEENSEETMFNSEYSKIKPARINSNKTKTKSKGKTNERKYTNLTHRNTKKSSPFEMKSAFDKSSMLSEKMSHKSLQGTSFKIHNFTSLGNSSSKSLSKKMRSDVSKKDVSDWPPATFSPSY